MIPVTTWAAGAVAVLAIAAAGVQTVRLAGEEADHATTKTQAADARAEASRMHAKAETEQREEYERRQKEKDDAIEQAKTKIAVATAAAARADLAAGSLRESTIALVAAARKACGSSDTGPGGAPASDPIGVLADVQRRADERAGILAKYADAASIAGDACERSYDSLSKGEKPEQGANNGPETQQ